jgi:hypothetical protein
MSILSEYVDKEYINELFVGPSSINFNWFTCNKYQKYLTAGYTHSLYYNLNVGQYYRLYEDLFVNRQLEDRLFTAYTKNNSLKFCRYDGLAENIEPSISVYYETIDIEKTQIFTLDQSSLIYSIDKMNRFEDVSGLDANIFDSSHTFCAQGNWQFKEQGILYLGRHYTRKSFNKPACKYLRIKNRLPDTISGIKPIDKVYNINSVFQTIEDNVWCYFVMFLVNSKSACLFTESSMRLFANSLQLDIINNEYFDISVSNNSLIGPIPC